MQVDAWNIVLWAFAQSGQWFDALRTHEQMDSVRPKVDLGNTYLGKIFLILHSNMCKQLQAGIVPNADTWAALAHAAEKSGQWRIAADVLAGTISTCAFSFHCCESYQSKGVLIDVIFLRISLSCCGCTIEQMQRRRLAYLTRVCIAPVYELLLTVVNGAL